MGGCAQGRVLRRLSVVWSGFRFSTPKLILLIFWIKLVSPFRSTKPTVKLVSRSESNLLPEKPTPVFCTPAIILLEGVSFCYRKRIGFSHRNKSTPVVVSRSETTCLFWAELVFLVGNKPTLVLVSRSETLLHRVSCSFRKETHKC